MKNDLILINKKGEYIISNYIVAEFDIKQDNQKIRIINSYERSLLEDNFIKNKNELKNELEIKDNCEIKINGELIPFSYFHKFKTKDK